MEGPSLLINEVLADPGLLDAGCDGVVDTGDDEFVELVNTGQSALCLDGWTLTDADAAARHRFPLGSRIAPGETLVVFGGGVPTGSFGGASVQWAAFGGSLSLSNAGDLLLLSDATGALAQSISWGDCDDRPCAPEHLPFILGIDESVTRWPPFTGGFEPHASVAGVRYSPGIAPLPALPALGPPGRGLLLALLLGAGVLAARQRPRSAARPDASRGRARPGA